MYSDAFKEIPRIETTRLVLRSFERKDIEAYIKEFGNEKVQKHLGGVPVLKNEETHISNWLRNINDRLLKRKLVFTWLITKKENTDMSVGRIDLGGFQNKKAAEVAYYLWVDYWGNGYAEEAIRAVVKFGFENLELSRIQAIIDENNNNSKKIIMKSGFQKEGFLRNYPIGKSLRNFEIYSRIC